MPHCWTLTQQPVEKTGWWRWWMQMPGSLLKKMMLAWFREPWMLGLWEAVVAVAIQILA